MVNIFEYGRPCTEILRVLFFSQRSVPEMVSSLVDESTLTSGMFCHCQSLAYTLGWSTLGLACEGSLVDADRSLKADAAAICRKLVESDLLQIYLAS